jgi:hypothetical protein
MLSEVTMRMRAGWFMQLVLLLQMGYESAGVGALGFCFAPLLPWRPPSGCCPDESGRTRFAASAVLSSPVAASPAGSAGGNGSSGRSSGVLRSISVPDALAQDGIVSVPVQAAAVDRMQAVLEHLRQTTGNQFRRCAPVRAPVSRAGARANIQWTEEIPYFVEASNFRLADGSGEVYDVYTTGFAPTMRWVAVGDRATLDIWDSALGSTIQRQLEHSLGEKIVLCQACFVVVQGGLRQGDAKLHADWALEAIPRREVYTALTPLTDFPDDVGGLFFDQRSMPRERESLPLVGMNAAGDAGKAAGSRGPREVLHRYRRGEAVLFDGRLMHRSEPFGNAKYERVLASFSFCTASSLHRKFLPAIVQVLGDQTPAFYVSPAGEQVAPPLQFLSYDDARAAVRAAGVSDYNAFWYWSRHHGQKLRVAVHPHKAYRGRGWRGWDHFFQRD